MGNADVCEDFRDGCNFGFSRGAIRDELKRVPVTNVAPVKHGRWMITNTAKWIPTSEQMPPDEEFIIGFTPVDKNMFIGYHREDWRDPKGKWICLGPMGAPRVVTKKVTHWMPCPDVPEI